MGPEFWKLDKPSKLKKCSEFVSPACDTVPTDGCCAVIPCSYCLTWVPYGADTEYGTAEFDTDGWYGNINDVLFHGYWEVGYETGVCEFVVVLNDVEIYRNDCYGGQSCRDSSDSAEATIGYDTGTLTWTKILHRPLEYVVDPDTHCRKHFCGSCECSCECLCVTITEYNGPTTTGEICDVSYDCDGPVWEGTVGDYVLSLALGRDVYDECIITATVDGIEQPSVSVSGCNSMSGTITLEDGTTIFVRCKVCDCSVSRICCDRCLPLDCITGLPTDCVNGLPMTLTVDLTATPNWGTTTCFNGSGTITFKTPLTGGLCCWEGEITGTCVDCNGVTFNWSVLLTVCCGEAGWLVAAIPGSPCVMGTIGEAAIVPTSCDPVLLTGCFTNDIVGCFVGCLVDVTVVPPPTYTLCFDIYETP